MPRKYTKKSNYWKKFNQEASASVEPQPNVEPISAGTPFYVSEASYGRTDALTSTPGDRTSARINRAAVKQKIARYSQIRGGLLPYEMASDGINVRETIELCQKAYANVPIFRNTIDMMSEFANTSHYLKGGTAKSREFFDQLFKRIRLYDLKSQYFREYYRSGNIFLYRVDGQFNLGDYRKFVKNFADEPNENKFPVKYIILNPFDIVAKRSTIFSTDGGAYAKILSEFDMERLKNPKNDYDKQVFESLPKEVQKDIEAGAYFKDGLQVTLDNEKLSYSFYKKQDYEPFAIPFGYPVLEDINAKMEMKKVDQAIMRTVENVILMITMGAEPDKGGINHNNLAAMQKLFQNESVGRVLVSDHTTKADFIIPDLNKVVGPAKYEVINKDIKEGLQNIILNDDKYNGAQIKARVFLDRLKEARDSFINDFLQPEIKRIAKDLGFRSYPTVHFQEMDLRDEVQLMRVATRLMELGIVSAEQGMEIIQTGRFPEPQELDSAQNKFVDQRKKGYFNPIVGGVPMMEDDEEGDTPQQKGPSGEPGRPISRDQFSRANIQKTIVEIEQLRAVAVAKLKEKLGKKRLNKNQNELIDKLCESIVCASEKEQWEQNLISCVKNYDSIGNLGTLDGILDISDSHTLELYPSAILYHSNERN